MRYLFIIFLFVSIYGYSQTAELNYLFNNNATDVMGLHNGTAKEEWTYNGSNKVEGSYSGEATSSGARVITSNKVDFGSNGFLIALSFRSAAETGYPVIFSTRNTAGDGSGLEMFLDAANRKIQVRAHNGTDYDDLISATDGEQFIFRQDKICNHVRW